MIGIFDSGVGGLSVFLELKKILPQTATVYFADSRNFPYGEKSDLELAHITIEATGKLIDFGCDIVVVACNSATVSVIDRLRDRFPDIRFVGVEPAVKLGEKNTKNARLGLLATQKTVVTHQSDDLVGEIQIFRHHASGLISKIEQDLAAVTDLDLSEALEPLLEKGVDTVVLGCTHFYFVKERFELLYPEISFVEPAPYVAMQVKRLLDGKIEGGDDIYLVSGDHNKFKQFLVNILGDVDADIRQV